MLNLAVGGDFLSGPNKTADGKDYDLGGWTQPVQPKALFASRSVRRALLMLQVNPGSRYRCGKSP